MASPRRKNLSGILAGVIPQVKAAAQASEAKPDKGRAKAAPKPVAARSEEPPAAKARGTNLTGIKQQTLYLAEPIHNQLRELAFSERVKMHDIILEGLDLVFEKRGMKSIARLKPKD